MAEIDHWGMPNWRAILGTDALSRILLDAMLARQEESDEAQDIGLASPRAEGAAQEAGP